MKYLISLILAVPCLAQTTQPAPLVDASDAIAHVTTLAATANGRIIALAAQHATDAATIAALRAQLAQPAASQPTTRPIPGWMLANLYAPGEIAPVQFADLTRSCSPFQNYDASKPFALNANGYPVGATATTPIAARSRSSMISCPAGKYRVEWKGNASVNLGIYSVSGMTWSWVQTGPNSGTLAIGADVKATGDNNVSTATLWINCTSSDPAAPLDQLHIWLPGYGPGSPHDGRMYRDEYLATLRPFCGVRSMAPDGTANHTAPAGGWAARTQMSNYDWSAEVPVEAQIELFKEASQLRVWWVTTPIGADDAHITAKAKMIHDALPGVMVIPELANENWNLPSFAGAVYVDHQANAANVYAYDGPIVNGKFIQTPTGQPGQTDSVTRSARCAASLAAHLARLWIATYADRPADCKPVLGGIAANPLWLQVGLQFLTARDGSHPFQLLAIAPYFDWRFNAGPANNWAGYFAAQVDPAAVTSGAWTMADVFASVSLFMADNTQAGSGLAWQLATNAATAAQYGCQLVDYEGDESFNVNPYNPTSLAVLAQSDPRMGATCDAYYIQLHAAVACHCSFQPVGSLWGWWGCWGALQDFYPSTQAASPRWQSLVRAAAHWN